MNYRHLAFLVLAGTLLASCQTMKTIGKNWDNLSEFRLPADSALADQGRLFRNGDSYTLGAVTTQRKVEKLEPDFWTMFFHGLFDDEDKGPGKDMFARYRVIDTLSVAGEPKYELNIVYSISIDKDGTDSSEGVSSLVLRRLPDRKRVDFQRTAQIGLERFLQGDVPETVKVRYYFNDLDRTGGWADVLRLPTGVAIKTSAGYQAILDLRYERHYYLADSSDGSEAHLIALMLAALVWDSDEMKKEFVEQTRQE